MINKDKNKRVQCTLPKETEELLRSLSNRYHKTSSEIIKWALNVLAAKKHHNLLIKYREQEEDSKKEESKKLENMSPEERRKAKSEEVDPEYWDKITN